MKKSLIFFMFIIYSFILIPGSFAAGGKNIALFTTREKNDMFWGVVADLMHEACEDLGMKLTHFPAKGNHMKMVELAKKAIASKKFDALVVPNFKKRLPIIIRLADKTGIPVFTFNSGFLDKDNMGEPREKYKSWIGEMLPDDVGAGYGLADILVKAAIKKGKKLNLVGFEGNVADAASINRKAGLKKYIREHSEVTLHQVFSVNWDPKLAKKKSIGVFKRYPDTSIIWCASDGMALGAIEGSVGKGILTGGVDWSADGIKAVKDKSNMIATMGGHIYEGAWVAVLLYDYFNGIDFKSETLRFKSKMSGITKDNVAKFQNKLSRKNWKAIDFSKFSKVKNPSLKKYDFSLDALLKQL